MALLTVNLPDNLKEEFKMASFLSKRSMSDIVLDSVKKFVNVNKDNRETEYLISTKANKEALDKSIEDIEKGKFKNVNLENL